MTDKKPGPDDIVRVQVGKKAKPVEIDYGAGKDTHPLGSGSKPTAEREAKAKRDGNPR